MITRQVGAALASSFGGTFALVGSWTTEIFGQTSSVSTDIAPFLSGGGSVAAVGGLVYMARKLTNGELVAVDVRRREEQIQACVDEGLKREAQLNILAEGALQRDTISRDAIAQMNQFIGEISAKLGRSRSQERERE